jgi:hypothetical protein
VIIQPGRENVGLLTDLAPTQSARLRPQYQLAARVAGPALFLRPAGLGERKRLRHRDPQRARDGQAGVLGESLGAGLPAGGDGHAQLRLDEDERDHLYLLAGQRPPAGRLAGSHVRPGLLYLLDQLTAVPAQLVSDLGDLLAQNAMAETLFGSVCATGQHDHEQDHNIVWRWFNDPRLRVAFPADEHNYYSRLHVADLRAAVARRGADPAATALVERLRAGSAEFAQLWDLHEVAVRRHSRLRLQHPTVGLLELDSETLLTPAEDQRLVLLTAPPGTPTADYLELLRVAGQESFVSRG